MQINIDDNKRNNIRNSYNLDIDKEIGNYMIYIFKII